MAGDQPTKELVGPDLSHLGPSRIDKACDELAKNLIAHIRRTTGKTGPINFCYNGIPLKTFLDSITVRSGDAATQNTPVDEADKAVKNDTIPSPSVLRPVKTVIWDDEWDRDAALKKHLAAIGHEAKSTHIPNIFNHGVRFIRHDSGGEADPDEPDARQSRTIIIANIPESVDLGTVLAQVPADLVIKAMLVPGLKPYGPRAGVIHMSKHQCAQKVFDFYNAHPLLFLGGENTDQVFEAAVILPDTDTYPLSGYVENMIRGGRTRHMEFSMALGDLWAVLQAAGLGLQHFGGDITNFKEEVENQCYRVEFSSLQVAERVHIARNELFNQAIEADSGCDMDSETDGSTDSGDDTNEEDDADNEQDLYEDYTDDEEYAHGEPPDYPEEDEIDPPPTVKYLPDSCSEIIKTAEDTIQPLHGRQLAHSFQDLLFRREGIRLVMSEETCGVLHAHLPITQPPAGGFDSRGRYQYQDHLLFDTEINKTADWFAPDVTHWEARNKEGQLCRWSMDPRSGAKRFEPFYKQDGSTNGPLAAPTMYQADYVKEWLHYNLDTSDVKTQEALDNYFGSRGLLNLRKINNDSIRTLWPLPPKNFLSFTNVL